jgi:hypothetical protein
MTSGKRVRRSDCDAELDAVIAASRDSFIAHYNATFDFDAGLDDVYAQAGLARSTGDEPRRQLPGGRAAARRAVRQWVSPAPPGRAVQALCRAAETCRRAGSIRRNSLAARRRRAW